MYNPFLTEETFFVATKCCLIKDGKILVVAEDRPGKPIWWELPGGKISKKDEDLLPIESLARELKEEIGSDFGILSGDPQLFMVHKSYEDTTFSDQKVPFIFLCYIYEISTLENIVLSHEHAECDWIGEDQISSIINWRGGFDSILKNAFNYINK